MAHMTARGSQEFASPQPTLACSRHRGPRQIASSRQLQRSADQRARGPREFASVQLVLACSRRPLVPVRGPITKRKRGRIFGVGYGGVGALLPLSRPSRKRKRGPALVCSRRPLFPVSEPITKRKRGRILGVG